MEKPQRQKKQPESCFKKCFLFQNLCSINDRTLVFAAWPGPAAWTLLSLLKCRVPGPNPRPADPELAFNNAHT